MPSEATNTAWGLTERRAKIIITPEQAMNADIIVNGGNGDCRVNFSGTDR